MLLLLFTALTDNKLIKKLYKKWAARRFLRPGTKVLHVALATLVECPVQSWHPRIDQFLGQ